MSFLSPWTLYQWLASSSLGWSNHSRTSCSISHTHGFLSLPSELLVDVLARLDCSSIFSARMTCCRLYKVTKSRHLWLRVIGRLERERGLVPPEEGISRYSIGELENWTLRRTAADAVLKLQLKARPHVRLIDLRTQDFDDFCVPEPYFLPGGRWFLLAHQSSRMLLYDLDSTDPIRKCLFNPLDFDEELASEYVRYTFWFDHSSPSLSFNVAANALNVDHPRTIVYTVQLTGHGASANLSASLSAAFQSYGRKGWPLGRFAVNKRYYIEIRGDPNDSKNQDILAYELQEASGSSDYRSVKPVAQTRFVGERIRLAAFIYDDLLAICTRQDAIRLYEIAMSDCPSSSSFHLLYTVPFSYNVRSSIRWSPLESYMVSVTREGEFQGLRIPYNKTMVPTISKLGKHDTFLDQKTGWDLDTSVSVSLDDYRASVEIISHPWTNMADDTFPPSYFKRSHDTFRVPCLGWGARVAGFSEDIGRLVVFKDGSHTSIVVVDLTAARYLHKY